MAAMLQMVFSNALLYFLIQTKYSESQTLDQWNVVIWISVRASEGNFISDNSVSYHYN